MKLTKKQVGRLEYVLGNLERAKAFLMEERIAVAVKGKFASTTLHYSRADGQTLYEVDKEIGSNLTGLWEGISALRKFLDSERIGS